MYIVVVKSEELKIQKGYKFNKSKDATDKIRTVYEDMWKFLNEYGRHQDRSGSYGKYEAYIRSKDVNVFIFSVEVE